MVVNWRWRNIMKMLTQESPRIAILGGGGMGKTSLARGVLHHPDTSANLKTDFCQCRILQPPALNLLPLIGLHVGLSPGTNLTRPVVQYLSCKSSCLLVLDNLETVWEPIQSRGGIEEFLALLTAVKRLALILKLPQQTFMEITDNVYRKEEVEKILQFTDNMPLAVDLMAHCLTMRVFQNVLARWDTERTAVLSQGIVEPSPQSFLTDSLMLNWSKANFQFPMFSVARDSNWRLRITGRAGLALMEHIQSIVPGLDDYHLKIQFMTQVLLSYDYYPTFDREQIITEAIRTLELVNNPVVESKFYMAAGNFKQSVDQLHRSRVMLGICGLADGSLDRQIAIAQGEFYLQKSEYAEARDIYNHIVETNSPEQDPSSYAIQECIPQFKPSKDIPGAAMLPRHVICCCTAEADLELIEEKFEIAKILELGQLLNAHRWPVMYCGRAYKSKDKLELHKALLFLGDVFLATEDDETATNLYIVAWKDLSTWTYIGHRSRHNAWYVWETWQTNKAYIKGDWLLDNSPPTV
ncbi:hypothetical protein B0H14DRAFT_3600608 [Mycena olivaceomarginata]|nr:hypothetical protein B0H14DRAFT_3600608 [Mycena olivaceomarginata]